MVFGRLLLAFGLHSPFVCPFSQLFERNYCQLLDFCSKNVLERSLFFSVGIQLDNIMDFNALVVKSIFISEPP